MRLVQISDFHFSHLTWNPFRLFSKRLLGNLNWLFRRKGHFFEEQLQDLLKLFETMNPDLILFGGDFTTTSLKEEFEKAFRWVSKIKYPWIAIPGNHDRYTRRSCKKKHFYNYFANQRKSISHPVEFFKLKDHRVEAHLLERNWWLVALDTTAATSLISSEGIFSIQNEKFLKEVLKIIPEEASIILFNHFPFFQNDHKLHNLVRGEVLQKLIEEDPRIRLYLHGHTHRHSVADLQVSNLPIILDSGSCAQGKRGTWNLIDIDPEKCNISTYRWDDSWKKMKTEEFQWKRSGTKTV